MEREEVSDINFILRLLALSSASPRPFSFFVRFCYLSLNVNKPGLKNLKIPYC